MLSELLAQFIQKSKTIDATLSDIKVLKAQIENDISDGVITEKIENSLYLHSDEFATKTATALDIDALINALPKEELNKKLQVYAQQSVSEEKIANALLSDEDFKNTLKTRIGIEALSAINSLDLDEQYKQKIHDALLPMITEALNELKINHYRMESALNLWIIRLHTKCVLVDSVYSEKMKLNIYKRI